MEFYSAGGGMQSLPLQLGNGLPSARSSMGKAVKVASTRRRRASF